MDAEEERMSAGGANPREAASLDGAKPQEATLGSSAALASPPAASRLRGPEVELPFDDAEGKRTAAVFCVGNRLMLDEGVGPTVYDELCEHYEIPDNVQLFDVGCMSLDMLGYVDSCDLILTVDAVDGTGDAPGTVYRFAPDAMARHTGAMQSLHDLKLVDLFDAASLLGYEAEGFCLGMQVDNMSPAEFTVGLTPAVHAALPLLVETTVAELDRRGFKLRRK